MKLVKLFAIIFILLISISWTSPVSAGVTGQTLDQENSTLPWVDCSQIDALNRSQTFKPSLNRIISVDLYLAARANNAEITLTITKDSDGSTVGQATSQLSGGPNETWETFAFSDPFVTVTPEASYSLNLLSSEDQTRICYTNDLYSRGYYRTVPTTDWLFKIYGKNVADPSGSTSNSTNPTSTSTKPSAISAPNNLQATYKDPLTVNLIWNKSSTTNITGYNIYRSQNKTDNLIKIGSVDKNTIAYEDKTGLEHGKSYYYYVRAYNSAVESANSNEALASVPAAVTNVAPVAQPWYKKYLVYLIIGGAILLAGLFVFLFFLYKKREKSKLAKIKEG